MPDNGKLSTWLIENGGMMMTWTIVCAIVLLTLWVKKDEWFGSGKKPAVPKPEAKATEPEPKKEPEKEPVKVEKPKPSTDEAELEKRRQKSVENFRAGLWRTFGGLIAVSFVVLLFGNLVNGCENYKRTGSVSSTPTASVGIPGASAHFAGKYTFEDEVKRFWYSDPDLALSPRDAWNMVDTSKHESPGFRMYNMDGSVARGMKNPRDVGALMINLDESKEEIAEAGCTEQSMESFECQTRVARIKYKKYGHKPWKAYNVVMKKTVTTVVITAEVGVWSEIYYVQQGSSCLWTVDREVDMRLASGEVKKLIPEKATFFDSPTTMYSVPDEPAGTVTIECRY